MPPNPEPFYTLVWAIVCQIPAGKVSSYGQIASMIPPPEDVEPLQYDRLGARWVGSAMRATPSDDIPWQRVINSQGKISLPGGSAGADEQRYLLELEGVKFSKSGYVNFDVYGWEGPAPKWLAEMGLFPPRPLSKKPPKDSSTQLSLF